MSFIWIQFAVHVNVPHTTTQVCRACVVVQRDANADVIRDQTQNCSPIISTRPLPPKELTAYDG